MTAQAKKSPKEAQTVKSSEELQKDLATKRQDLVEAKRSLAAGELSNTNVISGTKKEIARLMTEINQSKGKVQ